MTVSLSATTFRLRLNARFSLSYREVEDLLADRAFDVSYDTVRRQSLKLSDPCRPENFSAIALRE